MSLSAAILSLSTGTYTVTRYEPATNLSGVVVPGDSESFTIVASVQPLTGRELKSLPEGMRTEEMRALWTPTELRTQGTDNDPDKVTIGSETWEVVRVEPWPELGDYYKVTLAKSGR